MRITVENTAVLVVDYQEKLMPVIKDGEKLIENSRKLLAGLKILEIPVIVSQQYTKGLGMTVKQIQEVLQPPFSYFDKVTFSCVRNAGIEKALKELGRKNIILCGAETHICVLQTALDLKEAGYEAILAENCTGSRKAEDHRAAAGRMQMEGIRIGTYEAILFELLGTAGTEEFKKISRIIK